jgi:(S)-3,5-dihydroxyphenylglycine transaminase
LKRPWGFGSANIKALYEAVERDRMSGDDPVAPAGVPEAILRKEDLHASLSAPVLDTMNFLNEITFHYPAAISFAPDRLYGSFLDTEQIITYIRGYLSHLSATGESLGKIRDALSQYGPTAGRIRELIADSLE